MSAAAPQRRSWLWLQGLACGAAVALAPGPALLVAVLLAPALVAYGFERTPGKPRSEPMLILSSAACFEPMRELWSTGRTIEASFALLSEPRHIAWAWLAAAAAWLIGEVVQLVSREFGEITVRRRVAALRQERDALTAEWGPLDPPPRR